MTNIVPWKVPIHARWYRSTDLRELRKTESGLVLRLVEDETEREWDLRFRAVQAIRVTTEECAAPLIVALPKDGGFFEVLESPWLYELGKGRVAFLEHSRHFIVCCYDEVIEIVASTEGEFEQLVESRDDGEER